MTRQKWGITALSSGESSARAAQPRDAWSRRRILGDSLRMLAAGVLLPQVLGCDKSDDDTAAEPLPAPRPQPDSPATALTELRDGNRRFTTRQPLLRTTADIERVWTELTMGQMPFATVLGCADSRLAPELIFDQFFGDLFVVREAGNIAASPTNLGSLEYAQAVLGSKILLVLGHSSCGAVKAAFDNAMPGGNIQSLVNHIRPGIAGAPDLNQAIAKNVQAVMAQIRKDSPLLAQAETAGKMLIVGAVYSIVTGVVTFMA